MDYKKIYDNLMESRLSMKEERLSQKKDGVYFEGHHIIPKSKGGLGISTKPKNNPNIVLLTAREHFLAHWLLWRIYRDRQSALAFHKMMSSTKNTKRITSSRGYEEAREAFRITNIGNQYGKGKTKVISEEQKKRQSELMKGRNLGDNNPSKRLDVRKKISEKLKGVKKTPEQIEKLRKRSLEYKVECPHCKRCFDTRNAKKWHFDYCSLNLNKKERVKTNFSEGNTYGCKKVLDLTTNQTYSSVKEIAEIYKVHYSTITRWLKKGIKMKYFVE